MRKLLTLLAFAAALAAPLPASAQDEVPSLVTILTAPEPQTQLMAMVLTMPVDAAGRGGACPALWSCR